MALPPIHRIDAPIVFVSPDDDAWDEERYKQETSEMADGDVAGHPLYRYVAGQTRYDIGPVREYLREDKRPTRFHLRRLTRLDWGRCRDLMAEGRHTEAAFLAAQRGLQRVDGVGGLEHLDSGSRPFSEADMDVIEGKIGRLMLVKVGQAVIAASADLTDAEGKR